MADLSSPCNFVCLYVRKYVAEGSLGYGHKIQNPINTSSESKLRAINVFKNFAYAITDSSAVIPRVWAHLDSWFAGHLFMRDVRRHYGMETHWRDMILFARPDVVYSHGINVHHIHQPAAIYLAHSASRTATGNDPTELFFLVSRDAWERVMDNCSVKIKNRSIQFCDNIHNCENKSLDLMAEAPEVFDTRLAYGPSRFGITIVRMNGMRITLNGMTAPRIVTKRLDFNQDILRFHSRCFRNNNATNTFLHRKALLHHYIAKSRGTW